MNQGPRDSERLRASSDFEETTKQATPPVRRAARTEVDDEETVANREVTGTETQPHFDCGESDETEAIQLATMDASGPTAKRTGSATASLSPSRQQAPERTLVIAAQAPPPVPARPAPRLMHTQPMVPAGPPLPTTTPPPPQVSMPVPAEPAPSIPPRSATHSRAVQKRIRTLRILLFFVWATIIGLTLFALRVIRELRSDRAAAREHQLEPLVTPNSVPPTATRAPAVAHASVDPISTTTSADPPTEPTPSDFPAASTPPPPSAAASPASSAVSIPASSVAGAPPTPAPGPDEGVLITWQALSGRRVWLDEHLLGQTPEPFTVKCGRHHVRIGTGGRTQTVDVPCGGELPVK